MKRQTPFGRGHELEYGLKIVERDPDDKMVTAVQCQFCVFIGRETREGPGVKRKRTSNVHLFHMPFRPELYRKHLEQQHPNDWAEYKALTNEQKKSFFEEKERSGINPYLENTKDSITFDISNVAIVDDIIGNMFFHSELDDDGPDSEPISKANAMKLFCPIFNDEADENDTDEHGVIHKYVVKIKNPLRFWLAIDHIKVGLSFRQAAAVITQHRNRTKNVKLMGISDHMVGQFVRVLLAVALQLLSNVLCNESMWAFSLAGDASTHQGTPWLDQRIRVCFNGVLRNLHLVLVPFFERHTAINYVTMINTVLDILCPKWKDKLISIASDGENTMTGRIGGVVTLLANQCTNPVLRVWCVPHQLDLVVKMATNGVNHGEFYKTAHAFSVHLRGQHNLITEMDSKCPKDTTRWVAFGNMLKWMIGKRRRLLLHVQEKRPAQAPPAQWWIQAASLHPFFETLSTTLTILQAHNMVISQQRDEMAALVAKICSGICVRSSLDESLEGVDPDTVVSKDDWWIARDSIRDHIHDQGSWVRNMYEELGDSAKASVVMEIGLFVLTIIVKGSVVQAERDGNNNPLGTEAPPVMPAVVSNMPTCTFIKDVLDRFRGHIEKHWSADNIDKIEDDHKELVHALKNDAVIKKALERHDEKIFFNDAWDSITSKKSDGTIRFASLRQFCGGLATAFPNTCSVESDFSVVKYEQDDRRMDLTLLSLAGIMHSKQYDVLSKLF
jgi:hypothetical protein